MADDQKYDPLKDSDYGDTLIDGNDSSQPTEPDEQDGDSSGRPSSNRIKEAHDKSEKIKDKKQRDSFSKPENAPRNSGNVGEGGVRNTANTAENAERAGSSAGRAGTTTAGEAAGEGAAASASSGAAAGSAAAGAGSTAAAGGTLAAGESAAVAAGTASGAATAGVGTAVTAGVVAGVEGAKFGVKEGTRYIKDPSMFFKRPGELVNTVEKKAKSASKWAAIIAIAIFAFIILFVVLIGGGTGWANDQGLLEEWEGSATQSPVTITKTGPPNDQVGNNQPITYTITIVANETASVVTVTDPIPQGTTYVSHVNSTGQVACDAGATCGPTSKTLTWTSTGLTAPFTTSFTITVKPTVINDYVVNIAVGKSSGATSGATGERGAPTCTGYKCALQYIASDNITQQYGSSHNGVDLGAISGTPIYALEAGSVYETNNDCIPDTGSTAEDNDGDPFRGRGCGQQAGNYVFIWTANKGNYKYMHMQRTAVGLNAIVARGQLIGYMDHTGWSKGTHLHFQIDNPRPVNPATVLANWPN